MNEEKKLTDEETVKAYIYCVLERKDCDNCPYDEVGCGVDGNDLIKIINRQKEEIERLSKVETELQELNIKYYNEAKDLRREVKRMTEESDEMFDRHAKENQGASILIEKRNNEIAELQKQVDELKGKICELVADKCNLVVKEQQAVKDTAREIYSKVKNKSGAELSFLNDLALWIKERFGVAVEKWIKN